MINPTIATSGNWLKNRQYHTMYTDANNVAEPTPVYAPADAVATEITHYLARMQPFSGEPYVASQFDVRFQASRDVRFWFDHISTLAEPFASLAAEEGSNDTRGAAVHVNVEVKAGDLIGLDHRDGSCAHVGFHCDRPAYNSPLRQPGAVRGDGRLDQPAPCCVSIRLLQRGDARGIHSEIRWDVRTRPGDPTFVDPKVMTTENCYRTRSCLWPMVRGNAHRRCPPTASCTTVNPLLLRSTEIGLEQ
jgi:hypothetical protein